MNEHNPQTITRKKYPSDATRSERRRLQRRKQQTARQQRWRDAVTVIEAIVPKLLSHEEDEQVLHEINRTIFRINKRLANKQTDEQAVMKSLRHGAWDVGEIVEETGFSRKYTKELLERLLDEGRCVRSGKYYKPVE